MTPRTTVALLVVALLVPFLSWIIDPWIFRTSLPPLLFLGSLLAACVMVAVRSHLPTATATASRRRDLALVAAAAMLIPALLLPTWPGASGDEPHYLLAAGSIWTDGDLDLAADYRDERFLPFWLGPLAPHAKPGRIEGSRYSSHGAGYPTLLTPAIAVAQLAGNEAWAVPIARGMQIGLYGCFAALLYSLVTAIGSVRAARIGVPAAVLLAPLVFAPPSLFPETLAMTLACAAFYLGRTPDRAARVLGTGLILAVLPWVAIKLVFVAVVIAAATLLRGSSQLPRRRLALLIGAPLLASAMLHMAFTWQLYGTLSPAAIYVGADPSVGRHTGQGSDWLAYLSDLPGALRTWVGYWLDQKDSLLAVGPHFLIAAAGVPWLWRHRRADLLTLIAIFMAHSAPYALSQELGGQSLPARPLMPVLWTLAVPLGVALAQPLTRVAAALSGALLALGAATTTFLAANPGLLTHDYNVKMSRLLLAFSPRGADLWRFFPLWVNFAEPRWSVTFGWLTVTCIAAFVLVTAGRRPSPWPTDYGWHARGAALALVALTLLHLGLRVNTPVSDGHRSEEIAPGVVAWIEGTYPELAWVEPGGVWVRPGAEREIVLASERPLRTVTLAVRSLVGNNVTVRLGDDRVELNLVAGPHSIESLSPGQSYRLAGGHAYLLRVRARAGAAPAQLEDSADYRVLGAHLSIIAAEFDPGR